MPVTSIDMNEAALTMRVTSHYDAPVDRVWQMWADPSLLERWWGPPTYPATVTEHDLRPGGTVRYHMTGPEGDVHGGWWSISVVEPPHLLEFEDGFADADGGKNDQLPTISNRVTLEEEGGRVRMTIETHFASTEAMSQLAAMGIEEGIRAATGQIDSLLEELASAEGATR